MAGLGGLLVQQPSASAAGCSEASNSMTLASTSVADGESKGISYCCSIEMAAFANNGKRGRYQLLESIELTDRKSVVGCRHPACKDALTFE